MEFLSTLTYRSILIEPSYTLRDGDTRGTLHSTKNFEKFETGTNRTEISLGNFFQKIRKMLNSKNRTIQSFRNRGRNAKWNGYFRYVISENLGIPRKVVLFSGYSVTDADPFAIESFLKFRPKFFIKWKTPTLNLHRDAGIKVFPPDWETMTFNLLSVSL